MKVSVRKRSIKRERIQSVFLRGRTQPNSGAVNRHDLKADIKTRDFLVEDKFTDAASYSLKLETWRKLKDQALRNHRRPLMSIGIQNVNLYVIDELTMKEILELLPIT